MGKKKTRKNSKKTYSKRDFESNDGMLTTVWGPSLWHALHCMSFNYPVNPTNKQKRKYKKFVLGLEHVLPCGYCRKNFKNNIKSVPLTDNALKNRNNFSRWMYKLHEQVNKMLGKKSGLSYCDVRERYEHFRSRCTIDDLVKKNGLLKRKKRKKTRKRGKSKNGGKVREKGCTEPLYGKKSKCVIKIVPKDDRVNSFQIDEKCVKKR